MREELPTDVEGLRRGGSRTALQWKRAVGADPRVRPLINGSPVVIPAHAPFQITIPFKEVILLVIPVSVPTEE